MSALAIVACVALGLALSELVLMGLLVLAHTAMDAWSARQFRKRNPHGPGLAQARTDAVVYGRSTVSTNIIFWPDRG